MSIDKMFCIYYDIIYCEIDRDMALCFCLFGFDKSLFKKKLKKTYEVVTR